MSTKPILFNTEMVRAILDGLKTVTRRVVKTAHSGTLEVHDDIGGTARLCERCGAMCKGLNPPYNTGDILWVRETWCDPSGEGYPYWYKADFPLHWDADEVEIGIPVDLVSDDYIWRPSIHMPKSAARLFLRVKSVRVERLQEITEEGVLAEGIPDEWPMSKVYCPVCKGEGQIGTFHPVSLGHMDVDCPHCEKATKRFENLWNSTIKPDDIPRYGWDANPWVWVIEFERCERPEGWA